MTCIYMSLAYEDYKQIEQQMKDFRETTHTGTPGPFYHKSIRIRVTNDLMLELHGPTVKGRDAL